MSELVTKGASAALETVKQLMFTMKWTSAVDFDLFALCVGKDGSKTAVYFQNMGNLNSPPFMKLDKDDGVGDTGGDNSECIRVTDLDSHQTVYIGCLDYGAIGSGTPSRYEGSDLKVTVMTENTQGEGDVIPVDAGSNGNVVILAKIDNSSPMGATLSNVGKAGIIKQLTRDFADIWRIAESE